MIRNLSLTFLSLLTIFTSGCAQIPNQELSQYRDAFAEVQNASEDILIDFGAAIEAAEKRAGKPAAPAVKVAFSTELASLDGKQPGAVEVRRTALRTIDNFNNVLVTLAEGKSVESVQSTASGFAQAAGKFIAAATGTAVPGLSALSGALQTFVAQLEKARLRKEFEAAVRNGTPIINKMLGAFLDERADHLSLRADEATLRQVEIINNISVAASSVRDLFQAHEAPAAAAAPASTDDPKEDLQGELNTALKPAASGLNFGLPLVLNYKSGPPFGADQIAIAREAIARIQVEAAAFQANAAQYESLRSALNNYGTMLEKVRLALRDLTGALDKPVQFEEVADELFQVAFSLKRDIESFKAARMAAR